MNKDITAVVPVKGASERVKGKNIRPFHDTNLFELKLDQLKGVKGFDRIIVSSESEGILETARKKGFGTHARDPRYSTSDVPMSDVYSYIASEVPGEHIAWVNVTNPLAGTDVYEKAASLYRDMGKEHDCLLSVYEVKDYIFYKGEPVNFKPSPWPKSQDLEGMYALPFVVNILRREDMVRWGSCVGEKPYFYVLDRLTAMDVDWQEDFDFCEMIYKKRLGNA
ncbi:MAG: hypothetical protein PHH49_07740 [Candidatus Omnitrophica bacterium]|nr:hypothetical protein [Candidatus Omnitrophota bacterium]MDD5488828.1 hypothetical protein [Candidatus Omnitrophota bacterium]